MEKTPDVHSPADANPLMRPAALARQAHFEHTCKELVGSIDASIRAHALRLTSTGKLPAALDLRHLPREQVGTRIYAVNLAKELARLPELELTLLVRDPAQAKGLAGRVVTPETWRDDVAVIHKPAQVIDPAELPLLFQSSAQVVVTFQDLIGYRIPSAFPTDAAFASYRATSGLMLQAVQKVIAYSQCAAREINTEFGIPSTDVRVIPLGVDAEWFAKRDERSGLIRGRLRLPERYFFSLAADFPHKNLRNLLEAYAIFRQGWREKTVPSLVLAGNASGARGGLYGAIQVGRMAEGVTLLGAISDEELRVVYQHAIALVFPSLYEGFGLPPLEAMACGTPVIALRISAVPEVAGDCALYADRFSPASLASSMDRLARDEFLAERLRAAGAGRVREFRWDRTARATLEVYRAAILEPSERSLQLRRLFQGTLSRGVESERLISLVDATGAIDARLLHGSIGIRNSCRLLKAAIGARLRRELSHLPYAR
jgi:alpha-1,3-rhamnosyl/mannosyltransferase